MALQSIGKANMLKYKVGAPDASTDNEDQVCIPLDFALPKPLMPFCQEGLSGRLEYELTINTFNKVIKSSDTDSKYVIKHIRLEFDMVTDSELARQIRQQFSDRTAILYDLIKQSMDFDLSKYPHSAIICGQTGCGKT